MLRACCWTEKDKPYWAETDKPSFQELLAQLAEAHEREVRNAATGAPLDGGRKAPSSSANSTYETSESISPKEVQLVLVNGQEPKNGQLEEGQKSINPKSPEAMGPDAKPVDGSSMSNTRLSFSLTQIWSKNLVKVQHIGDHETFEDPQNRCQFNLNVPDIPPTEEEVCQAPTQGSRFVIDPQCTPKVAWDILSGFLILYDLLSVPYREAFQPKPDSFTTCMDWFTLAWWTLDMAQGFILAYIDKEEYVTSHSRILKHYVQTWLAIDVLVVVPGWISLVLVGQTNMFGSSTRLLKISRAVRILRLARVAKVERVFRQVYEVIGDELTFILVHLTRLLLMVLLLSHLVACAWYLIGRLCLENSMENWIQKAGIYDSPMVYQYTTSLHWSLTQFTPASIDISARNTPERVFSVVILFFAMVVFASIISSISAAMTNIRNQRDSNFKQLWILRRYLQENSVSLRLTTRIMRFLEHRMYEEQKHVRAHQVALLKDISQSLNAELMHQVTGQYVMEHPFFSNMMPDMTSYVYRICHTVLSRQHYASLETVFAVGEEATQMYFIVTSRSFMYEKNRTLLVPPLSRKEWASEAAMWTHWRHVGYLYALNPSELLIANPKKLAEVLGVHPKTWLYTKNYAETFIRHLNQMDLESLTDVSRGVFPTLPDHQSAVRMCRPMHTDFME